MSEYEINKEIKEKTALVITEINELIKLNTLDFQEDFFDCILEIVNRNDLDIEEFIELLEIYPTVKSDIGWVLIEQHYVDKLVSGDDKEKIRIKREIS